MKKSVAFDRTTQVRFKAQETELRIERRCLVDKHLFFRNLTGPSDTRVVIAQAEAGSVAHAFVAGRAAWVRGFLLQEGIHVDGGFWRWLWGGFTLVVQEDVLQALEVEVRLWQRHGQRAGGEQSRDDDEFETHVD